jgi:hypothetical protein
MWLSVLMGWGVLIFGNLSPGLAQEANPAEACSDRAVTCCAAPSLAGEMPGDSVALRQSFCELLLLPAFSLLDSEAFVRQVDPTTLFSDQDASPQSMTRPSLWLNRDILPERLGGHRLVQAWLVYELKASGTQVVDMAIDPQIWRILTYTERYAAMNRLATATESFGYNLRLFYAHTRNSELIGLYVCDFEAAPATDKAAGTSSGVTPYASQCVATFDAREIAQYQTSLVNAEAELAASSAFPAGPVATEPIALEAVTVEAVTSR